MPVLFANPRRQVFSRCGPFNVSIADPESFNIKFSFQYIRLETCHDWPSLTLKQSKIYHLRKRKKARDPKWILVVPLLIFPSCTGELSKKRKKKDREQLLTPLIKKKGSQNLQSRYHTGKCLRRFAGIYTYCR